MAVGKSAFKQENPLGACRKGRMWNEQGGIRDFFS